MDGIKAPSFDGTQPCTQVDPDIFFPDNAMESLEVKRYVKQICNSCKFQAPCLEYALKNDVIGTWGGMLDSERKSLKRHRRLSA